MEKEKLKIRIEQKFFAKGIPKSYQELCRIYLPRPIHDGVGYQQTLAVIDALAGFKLNADQEDYLDILSEQVEDYEAKTVKEPEKIRSLEMLRTACEETGITQAQLARILGKGEALVSLILKGERRLTVDNAKKLAAHFGLDAALFLDL